MQPRRLTGYLPNHRLYGSFGSNPKAKVEMIFIEARRWRRQTKSGQNPPNRRRGDLESWESSFDRSLV
jgi:hypothetical protein